VIKLSQDELKELDRAVTGPSNDSINCRPEPVPCASGPKREMVANDNKVLLFKYDNRPTPILVSCGTANQGMCHLLKPQDLSRGGKGGAIIFGSPNDTINYIASKKTVVALMAPPKTGLYDPLSDKSVLYAATEYDGRPTSMAPPVVSAKKFHVPRDRSQFA